MENKRKVHYFEKNGRYYKQESIYWEKHGIYVPQTPRRISKEVYETSKETGVTNE